MSQQGRAQTKGADVAVDDFAENLETLFHGDADQPVRPHTPTELPWSTLELRAALQKLRRNKSPDEHGLVAELLKHSTTDCHIVLLAAFNAILETGVVPGTWQKTIFTMLPKFKRALQPTDFRPVASLRLLYKTFAYMILGRIEKQLDKAQPEEQHGFRAKYRMEEHLLTANLVIDKTVATGKPVWIVSLDLSKAFDRVHWGSLWQALRQHEVSDHMVWILQCLYHDQVGTVRGSSGTIRPFDIRQGVRQGCVLSPRLFACVLQWALRSWRARVGHCGLDFEDGMAPLLDLRFADDLLLFAASKEELIFMLEELIGALQDVGLVLNASKTLVLTTEAQPPTSLRLQNGAEVSLLPRDCGHKWLGCFLTTKNVQGPTLDVEHHLQSAARAWFVHKWMLCDKNIPLGLRLKFFNAVITPVACFAAGHRILYPRDVRRYDIEMRKMLRRMIPPPVGIDWSAPWHEILHLWHARIDTAVHQFAFLPWSAVVTTKYWKFAAYIKTLPPQTWLRRCLDWTPPNNRRCGRPPFAWDEKVRAFSRWKQLGGWGETSTETWHRFESEFVAFITGR